MTIEVLLSELQDGDTILYNNKLRKIKNIEASDQDMYECGDLDCCGAPDYWDVWFEDGAYFWGHGNTPMDKLV